MKGILALVALFVVISFFPFSSLAVEKTLPTLFGQLPDIQNVTLSPSGKRIVFIKNFHDGDPVSILITRDLTTGKNYSLLSSDNEKVKINWFRWANDETLLISAKYASKSFGTRFHTTSLYVAKYDSQGKVPTNLVNRKAYKRYQIEEFKPQFQDQVVSFLPNDPEHILLALDIEFKNNPSVFKVNLNDGKFTRVEKARLGIREWFADRQGRLAAGVSLNYDTGEQRVYYRDNEQWKVLFEYNVLEDKDIDIKGFGLNPNTLYYTAYKGDFKALYTIDLSTKESLEVLSDEFYDVDGALIYSPVTNDAIGIYHNGPHYWDERLSKLQNGLSQALPDYNTYLSSFSADENYYILYADNDSTPGMFLLGDRKQGAIEMLFPQYPLVKSEHIGSHQLVIYQARDGKKIEGYLTLPKQGEAPYPTIIHPHGGPSGRDYGGFDTWTAYFSAKGYAVFRPNFRGSSGYGYEFAQAQVGAWGLQMQDDITDAALWMVERGYAAKDNMCIVGASYGGYAALMATVKTPNLFQCAVSFAGVSDLDLLYKKSRRFLNTKFVKRQLGEDGESRTQRSPINFVETISTPILLVHGNEDRTVAVEHSRDMASELEDFDKDYVYVELAGGDHHLSNENNRLRFFAELDAFLSKNLKQ